MTENSINRLYAAMTAEYGALVNFVALLEREQEMLLENRTDQLLELAGKKTTDALSLNKLADARRALLQKNVPQLTIDAIQAWLKTHSQDGLAIWQKILELAKRAHQMNDTNGELIQIKLRHNQQSLSVLSKAVNKANLYGPNGQPDFSAGSGKSLGSG